MSTPYIQMQYVPLTEKQKSRLDANGNRIWTEEETETIRRNLVFYDRVRHTLERRCRVPDCNYVVSSRQEDPDYALPEFASVCGACFYMHEALQHPKLKNIFYFRRLHEAWKKEMNDPKRNDRLGI